jgi:hypothetical protein
MTNCANSLPKTSLRKKPGQSLDATALVHEA